MSNKKFFALVFCMAMLFAVLFSAGCGGGNGGELMSFNGDDVSFDNPVPDSDDKPIVQPEDPNEHEEPDTSPDVTPESLKSIYVQYAIGQISIGYQPGDNSEHVTRNVTLPTRINDIDNDNINIAWSSSSPASISTEGAVTRQSSNVNVTLTVSVSDGSETEERSFNLTVIRKRSRSPEEVKSEMKINGIDEIKLMNQDNDDFQILYTASRDHITDIDGKYSDIIVDNADDALDTIWSIHNILGLDDPYEELVNSVITEDEYGAEYTFAQVYNGVRVYGRNMTVSTNSSGETDFVTSNILPFSTLAAANLDTIYTQEQAEDAAKKFYDGSFEVHSKGKVIFSLEDYESVPVTAYVVNIYGLKEGSESGYIDEDLFINALTGEVIFGYSNIHTVDIREGFNELDDPVSFPVIPDYYNNVEYMTTRIPEANNTTIIVYNNTADMANLVRHPAGEAWTDKQQISAYTNMIEILKWWKSEFNRDSIDGQGMVVKLITHERVFDNGRRRDNAAYWSTRDYEEGVYISDPDEDKRSSAAAIETLAHESTHGVLDYRIDRVGGDSINGYIDNFPYTGATGAINEGYADIFGCIITQQWKIHRDVHADGSYFRNIADPKDTKAKQVDRYGPSPANYSELDNTADGHINSSLISYPAYLMKTHVINNQEMTWKDLGRVWYKSMRMGYNATSDYKTVRTNLLRAAKKLNMSNDDITRIKNAFEEVGITNAKYKVRGTVSTYDKAPLQNVNVNVRVNVSSIFGDIQGRPYDAVTDSEGKFSLELPAGKYTIDITHGDYVPFNAFFEVEEGVEQFMKIRLVNKSTSQPSNLIGNVRDALTGALVEGASFKIWHGWNIHTGYTAAELSSEANGSYTTRMIAGYYTVEVSKEGYKTTLINDLVVPPGETITQNIILSPEAYMDDSYRITLQWDEKPRDLDAHLIGVLPDGQTFHVSYMKKQAFDSNGNIVANLDHDDTQGWGFETITFEAIPDARFKYFVHWFSDDDNNTVWSDSNAMINLYKSGTQSTFTVPDLDLGKSSYAYWLVFDLTTGMEATTPDDPDALVNAEPVLR